VLTFLRLLLLVALLFCAFTAGAIWSSTSNRPAQLFASTKSNIRQMLGLPKLWAPPPDEADPLGRTPVPCPDPEATFVVVTGGQSNAANTNSRQTETAPGDGVFTWFAGQCFTTRDPVLGASATGGSLWPVIGKGVAAELGRPVLFINGAIGGTQVSDWLDERSGYLGALERRIRSAQAAGFEPDLVFWHQGETDAGAMTDMAALDAQFRALTGRLLALMPKSRLYLFGASKCIGANRANGVPEVVAVQRAVADANDRIMRGMDTDQLDNDFRKDGCHFNSLGRDAIARQVVADIAAAFR